MVNLSLELSLWTILNDLRMLLLNLSPTMERTGIFPFILLAQLRPAKVF